MEMAAAHKAGKARRIPLENQSITIPEEMQFCGGNGCDGTTATRQFTENRFMSQPSPPAEGRAVFLRLLNFFPSPVSVPKPKLFLVCGKIDRQRSPSGNVAIPQRNKRCMRCRSLPKLAVYRGVPHSFTHDHRCRRRRPHRRPAPYVRMPLQDSDYRLEQSLRLRGCVRGERTALLKSVFEYSIVDKTRLPEIDAIRWGKIGSSPQNQKFCIHWPLPGQLPPSHERL